MSYKACPTEAELLSFADAALSPEQLGRVEQHMARCTSCAQQVKTLRTLIQDIAAPLAVATGKESDVAAHVASVMRRLDEPVSSLKQPRRMVWGGAMVGMAAAAALLLFQLRPEPETVEGEWAARGGSTVASLSRDVGVQLYAREPSLRALGPGSHVRADVALTAGLRNLSDAQAYLLLFAIDSQQVVHWIAPHFTSSRTDPEAAMVSPSSRERLLSSSVVFDDLVPGPVRIVAVITLQPTHVSQIEALSGDELSSERLLQRFPLAEIRQVTIQVTPKHIP